MTQTQSPDEKARLKHDWTKLAIEQALASQWAEAVITNRNILDLFPSEPDAYNRLGKAYSELGQYTAATQAYNQTLKYSPNNTIAKKNIDRLSFLEEAPIQAHTGVGGQIDPQNFIEETGKTGITTLFNVAPPSVLAKVGVGDKVNLHGVSHTLHVRNSAGEDIGQIEPRLANRLIQFMAGGNRYAAAILSMEHGHVRLIIREEYQHPSMFGKVSFPSQGAGETIRAYTKDSMIRYDRDEDDDMLNDDEYYDGADETEEMSEVDLENTSDSEE
ncbi:MAG: tetratricopeptide repeat protein [Chloroflexota bacterium]|nr:tetratricopeptide repeat protein [Chloroflexota bacterium]